MSASAIDVLNNIHMLVLDVKHKISIGILDEDTLHQFSGAYKFQFDGHTKLLNDPKNINPEYSRRVIAHADRLHKEDFGVSLK